MDYRIEGQRFFLDGAPLSLFSGSFQYWRVEPDLWAPVLSKVKGMGFSLIETYMPWSVHEVSEGRFDFGEDDPHRDLPRFLETCHRAGVKVLARPGPHINAELTYFGFPERIFADDDIACRSADGTAVWLPAPFRMFPVPCYHHPRFTAQVRGWLEALAGAIPGAVHPDGPIIAVQADNECSKFFRTHPYDHDYSEHSIRLFRRFLLEKYESLEELNGAWRSSYGSWSLVDPPRCFNPSSREDLPRHLDWVEFGEYYINEALRSIASILRDCFGNCVPLFHNYPTVYPVTPFDLPGAEAFLDFQGIDMYPTRKQYHALRRGALLTSTMSRLPVMVEFASGGIYFAVPITLEDQRFTTWAAVMHGMRGINFYMLVERERWYGSPIRRDGKVRDERFEFYRGFLADVRSWGLEEMSPERPVLLLAVREYERLVAASTLPCPGSGLVADFLGMIEKAADLLVSDEEHGLSEPLAALYARTFAFWYWALSAAGVHFAIGESGAGGELLARHAMVIVPTFEFMDRSLQEKLLDYTRGGGTLVVGPRLPLLDERMWPCEVLATHMREPASVRPGGEVFGVRLEEVLVFDRGEGGEGEGPMLYREHVGGGALVHLGMVPGRVHSIQDGEPFRPLMDTLLRLSGLRPSFVPSEAVLDVAIWSNGSERLLLVANPGEAPVSARISNTGGSRFADPSTGEEMGGDGAIDVTVGPYSIKALRQVRT